MDDVRDWYIANTGYVLQLATPFYPELTVRENLTLAALMRLPRALSSEERLERIERVMKEVRASVHRPLVYRLLSSDLHQSSLPQGGMNFVSLLTGGSVQGVDPYNYNEPCPCPLPLALALECRYLLHTASVLVNTIMLATRSRHPKFLPLYIRHWVV